MCFANLPVSTSQEDLIPLIKQTQWRCMQFPCTVDINCAAVCKGRKELLEHMQNDHGVAVSTVISVSRLQELMTRNHHSTEVDL